MIDRPIDSDCITECPCGMFYDGCRANSCPVHPMCQGVPDGE